MTDSMDARAPLRRLTDADTKRTALAAKLRELGARFTERTVGELEILERCLERLRAGARDVLPEIEAIAHRIAGTGATLGFLATSAAAEMLERLAESTDADASRLAAALADLRTAVDRDAQRA